jgi:hypothetical protein
MIFYKIRNTNIEIPAYRQAGETNPKLESSKFKTLVWNICILKIRACFELIPAGCFARASNLEFPFLYKDPHSFER